MEKYNWKTEEMREGIYYSRILKFKEINFLPHKDVNQSVLGMLFHSFSWQIWFCKPFMAGKQLTLRRRT